MLRSMPANRRQNGTEPLDDANLKLLAELQADGRLSFAELGRRVGLSPPAVAERMARLEETGVITGYRAEVDPRVLPGGYGPELELPRGIAVVAARG